MPLRSLFGFSRAALSAPLFLAGDHYIVRKLGNEVLRVMIGGLRTRRRWFIALATIYRYGGEIATALAGIGVGAPVVAAVFEGKPDELRRALSDRWFLVGITALVLWFVIKMVVKEQGVETRALYAKDCRETFQNLYTELFEALRDPYPLSGIRSLQQVIDRTQRDAIAKNVWPWNPPQPRGKYVELELRRQIEEIRSTFMAGWAPLPEQESSEHDG
jgi:hypothetical protein